jgi:RNA polymerase sigma-70 factor (ECF subfamily)
VSYTDEHILSTFKEDGSKGIELIFHQYYEVMCRSAMRITKTRSLAEDIVQEVFYEMFRKRDSLNITSLSGYLKRAVFNRAINKVKSSKDIFDSDDLNIELTDNSISSQQELEYKELEDYLNEVIDRLPEKCRLVFVLNRFEELSYKEVSKKLDISVKTVENQMSKALRILREEMASYRNLLENEEMQ